MHPALKLGNHARADELALCELEFEELSCPYLALPRKIPSQRDLKFKSDKRNGTIGDHVEAVPDMTTYDLLSFSRCLKIFETVLRKRACRWISASGFLLEVYVLLIYHSI